MYDLHTFQSLKARLEKRSYTDWDNIAFIGTFLLEIDDEYVPAIAWTSVLGHMELYTGDYLRYLDDSIQLVGLNFESSVTIKASMLEDSEQDKDSLIYNAYLDAMVVQLEDGYDEEE